jgi:hypothetical protein
MKLVSSIYTLELDVEKLDVYRDSMLIIYQVKGEW